MRRTLVAAATLAACSIGPSQSFTPRAVPVTDGPLLFLESYLEIEGQRWNLHHVCDPRSGEPAREFLRLHGNLDVAHRFGRDLLLLKSYHDHRGLLLLQLGTGKWRQMSRGNPHELITIRGDVVVYVTQDGSLMAHGVAPDAVPRRLLEPFVQRVVNSDDDDLIVLTAGASPALWLVPVSGGEPRKVVSVPAEWMPSMLTAQLAPDRRHLAVGVVTNKSAFHRGSVMVYALDGPRLLCRASDICIEVSRLSSFMPKVKLGWRGAGTVRFSESEFREEDRVMIRGKMVWVDFDIHRGERVGREEYGPIGLYHEDPDDQLPREERYRDGWFEREPGLLYLAGESEPLADFRNERGQPRWGDLVVAPGGHWAAVIVHKPTAHVDLVDGRHGTLRTILESWAYDMTWYP